MNVEGNKHPYQRKEYLGREKGNNVESIKNTKAVEEQVEQQMKDAEKYIEKAAKIY